MNCLTTDKARDIKLNIVCIACRTAHTMTASISWLPLVCAFPVTTQHAHHDCFVSAGSPLSGQGGLISPRSMSGTTGPLATSLKGLFQRQQSPSAPLPAFTATRNSTETPKSSVSVGMLCYAF